LLVQVEPTNNISKKKKKKTGTRLGKEQKTLHILHCQTMVILQILLRMVVITQRIGASEELLIRFFRAPLDLGMLHG
jgi:hypothetical protein